MALKIVEVNPSIRENVEASGGYCPCAIWQNEDTKCMCREFREQSDPGKCHCGRFEKVVQVMAELKAYLCWFVHDDEWGSYVVAASRGQAKAVFWRSFNDCGEWNDIRCKKVKDIPDDILIAPQCLDVPGDPVLKLLGLEYKDLEE